METAVWSTEMNLGIPLFDEAHEALAEQIALLMDGPDHEFGEGLVLLIECLETDFRSEEDLMEAIDYPAIQGHREQHARVLATLHGLDINDLPACRKAVALILPWFHAHLATADTALAIVLKMVGQNVGSTVETHARRIK